MKRYIRSGTTLHYSKSAFGGFVGDSFTTDLDSFISRFKTVEGDPSSRYVLFLKRSNIAHSYYEKVIYFNDLDECKRVAKDLIYNNAPNPEKWYEDHYYVNIVDQDTGEEIFYADAWQGGKKGWYDTIESAIDVPDYTPMDFDNKMDVMKWLDDAEKVIRKLCKEISNDKCFYEVDDVRWGTDCFEIPIFKGYWNEDPLSGPGRYEQYDLFRFCYDRDDTFERSAEEQLKDALDEFSSTYDKERKFARKMKQGRYEI